MFKQFIDPKGYNMHIEFNGLITKKEYRRVFSLHYSGRRLVRFFFIGLFFLLLSVFGLISNILRHSNFSYFIISLVFGAALCSYQWWLPLLSARSYNNPKNFFNQPIHGVIDDNGFSIETALVSGTTKWALFEGYRYKDDLLLIYQNKNCFNILTRPLFVSDDDWNILLTFLKNRFPKQYSQDR
jgi:hypothetical protein